MVCCSHEICLIVSLKRRQVVEIYLGQLFGHKPPEHKPFKGRINRRSIWIVVICPWCHNIPFSNGIMIAWTTIVARVVKVRQTEHMSKLVAESAYTRHSGTIISAQFGGAGIIAQILTIVLLIRHYIRAVRPNSVLTASLCLIVSGKEDKHIVDIVIVIIVVEAEIHIFRCKTAGFNNHISGACVTPTTICAIVWHIVWKRIRSDNIKLWLKLIVGTSKEIVGSTACCSIFVVPLFVQKVGESLLCIFGFETHICKTNKYNKTSERTKGRKSFGCLFVGFAIGVVLIALLLDYRPLTMLDYGTLTMLDYGTLTL